VQEKLPWMKRAHPLLCGRHDSIVEVKGFTSREILLDFQRKTMLKSLKLSIIVLFHRKKHYTFRLRTLKIANLNEGPNPKYQKVFFQVLFL
jgi:hypothetical protein